MGLAIPRPSMRAKESRTITARLKEHYRLWKKFEAEGMEREAASEKAYDIVTGRIKEADHDT